MMERIFHDKFDLETTQGVFQPGDGTRYVIQITKVPPGLGPLENGFGQSSNGYYVFDVIGMAKSFEFPIGDMLAYPYAKERMDANSWTVRALLLFIEECGLEDIKVKMHDHVRSGKAF